EGIPAAADIVNLRYKSCSEMEGQDQIHASTISVTKNCTFRFTVAKISACKVGTGEIGSSKITKRNIASR
ncbi:hypothetical protein POV07_09955, partial [Enterobacter roggenkampii]